VGSFGENGMQQNYRVQSKVDSALTKAMYII